MLETASVRTAPVARRTAGVALEVLIASVAPAEVVVWATASAPTDFAARPTAGVEVDLPIADREHLLLLLLPRPPLLAPAEVAVWATASAPTDFVARLTAGVEADLLIVLKMGRIQLLHHILLQFLLLLILPLPPSPVASLGILQSTGIPRSP